MLFGDLIELLTFPATDGQRAFDDAAAIHAIDRQFTFSSFQESARYSAERLRAAGLSDVEILQAPADGRSVFGDWMMPLAWEVEEGSFDLIAPDGSVQRIADRAEAPQSVAMWSAPTPPEGIEAEIVWIADAADPAGYPPEGVRGKIVFTSAHPHRAKMVVLERGGIGILSDFQTRGANLPEAVSWINSWSDDPGGWAVHADDGPAWAFLISPRQGDQLRARLKTGERLRGRAIVRSRLGAGFLPAVTGVIPGSGKEEVLLLGHQFEQGAIDNASGIGIMIEAARVLRELIARGKLPPPQRAIRCLFVSECYTTFYWTETSRAARHTVAALCLDSPAGDPNMMARPLEAHANPHSQMSYVDALLVHLTQAVMRNMRGYPWGQAAFSATDNFIADPSIGIPCPWLGAHSRTWHTSADTTDLLDPVQLGLVAQITAAYSHLIATADARRALDFAHLAAARGRTALADTGIAELDLLARGYSDLDNAMLHLEYLAERHAEAVGSALKLAPPAARGRIRSHVRALQRDLRRAGRAEAAALARSAGRPAHEPAAPEWEAALAAIRPRRLVKGPLTLDRVPRDQRAGRPDPRWSATLFSLLSWCNGKRSLAEACYLATRELRGSSAPIAPDEIIRQVDPSAASMIEYFEFLRQHGYVAW